MDFNNQHILTHIKGQKELLFKENTKDGSQLVACAWNLTAGVSSEPPHKGMSESVHVNVHARAHTH